MPYMLRKRILAKNDLDDDATWKEDLPDSGMVTAFELRIGCNRQGDRSDGSDPHPLVDMVSRVEIIAESTKKVLSVSGRQLDFLNYIDFRRPNPRRHREVDGGGNDLILFLMGGRSLYDREYGFDMSKLANAFLNYTYDLSEGVADYFAANDHDISVYAWTWMGPDVPMFKGYFRTRQVLDYTTTGADNLKLLKITPGLPLRRIIVQKKTFATTLGGTWSDIELEVNNGEYSPVRITNMMDWLWQQVQDYGLQNVQSGKVYMPVALGRVTAPPDFSYYQDVVTTPHGFAGEMTAGVYCDITLPLRIDGQQVAEISYQARGYGFQGCLLIGFDHEADGGDLLDTAGMSALNLVLTEVADGLTGAITLQEVMLY